MKRNFVKTAFILPVFAFTLLGLSSCKDNGPLISENRDTAAFSGVELEGSGNVTIQFDSVTSVHVETNEDIMDNLKTVVNNNRLVIRFDKNIRGKHETNILLKTPNLNFVKLSGSGNMHVKDTFVTNQMSVILSGSGKITVPALADIFQTELSGSGNINLSGEATQYRASLDGSGNINSFDLISDTAVADLEGSGNINLYVLRKLDATLNGSGNITYRGNPASVNSNTNGSGKIKQAN